MANGRPGLLEGMRGTRSLWNPKVSGGCNPVVSVPRLYRGVPHSRAPHLYEDVHDLAPLHVAADQERAAQRVQRLAVLGHDGVVPLGLRRQQQHPPMTPRAHILGCWRDWRTAKSTRRAPPALLPATTTTTTQPASQAGTHLEARVGRTAVFGGQVVTCDVKHSFLGPNTIDFHV